MRILLGREILGQREGFEEKKERFDFPEYKGFWLFLVIMKGFGILLMFLLIGTAAFVYLTFSRNGNTSLNPGMFSTGRRIAMTLIVKRRKLKGNTESPRKDEETSAVNLEDYRPIDPIPSSTASIRPGPIQHGTPLMPYIPEPSPSPPPSQARDGGFP